MWFAAWCAAGALLTFSFLTGLSIGLFVFPLAAGALLYVAWHAPHFFEGLGSVAGVGAMLLVVAFLNRDYRPCREGGHSLPADAPAGSSVGCGGMDATPWLLAGLVTVGLPLLAYAINALRGRDRDAASAR